VELLKLAYIVSPGIIIKVNPQAVIVCNRKLIKNILNFFKISIEPLERKSDVSSWYGGPHHGEKAG